MSASRLSGRLARIRSIERSRPENEPFAEETRVLPGWTRLAPNLLERTSRVSIPCAMGRLSPHFVLLFPKERERMEALWGASPLAEDCFFFDLETTGLSRGAGTVAFMASVGRLERRDTETALAVTQLLLTDFPGEPQFLGRLVELFSRSIAIVSFNGKCFDAQILWNRYLMSGIKPSFLDPDIPHLDLLFPARRLWKDRLESCRLGSLERNILGIERVDDLPGSEAPEAWFSFIRSGATEKLLAVADHNLDDTVSLARLMFAMDGAIDSATGRAALIRALEARRDRDYETSSTFLEPLAREGNPVAARILAIDAERRLGRLELALDMARLLQDEQRVARVLKKIDLRDGA